MRAIGWEEVARRIDELTAGREMVVVVRGTVFRGPLASVELTANSLEILFEWAGKRTNTDVHWTRGKKSEWLLLYKPNTSVLLDEDGEIQFHWLGDCYAIIFPAGELQLTQDMLKPSEAAEEVAERPVPSSRGRYP